MEDNNLESLRQKMDVITLDMIRLFLARIKIASEIGRLKVEIGRDVTDESREAELRENVLGLCRHETDLAGQEDEVGGLELGMQGEAYELIAVRFLNFLINESVRIQQQQQQQQPLHKRQSQYSLTHLSIFRRAKEMERAGRQIIHMEVGEPDFMPPPAVRQALTDAYDQRRVRYGPAKGVPELRQALARYASKKFGAKISAENVMVSPGARFAIFAAVTTLLSPADEMIIIEPAWPAYRECAMHAGIKVKSVHTTLADGWTPSPQKIASLITAHTKMIVLNYPNNPTGKVLEPSVMDAIIRIASDRGLYVLSDEIYSEYSSPGWRSLLSYGYDKGVTVQSFSKSHAMTGFRIGYVMAEPRIIDRMSSLAALCLTSVPEPIQYAAMAALDEDVSGHAVTMAERLAVLGREAQNLGLEFLPPDGSMYVFGRVQREGFDGAAFAESALERGVAIAPGVGFGAYRDFVRISACRDTKTLIEGMNRLKNMLEEGNVT